MSRAALPPGPPYPAAIQGIGFWTRPLAFLERCRARWDYAPAYSWIAFGGGRRRCLGASFAMLEAKLVMRAVLGERRPVAAAAA